MRATILNCTLKPSPSESNTEALARVVIDALEREEVETELIRVADFDYTVPGQTWTYWNKGPGPGDSYLETDDDEGKAWSKTTGETAAQNLVAVARALAAQPVPPPPSG